MNPFRIHSVYMQPNIVNTSINFENLKFIPYPLQCQTKIATEDILIFYFYLLKKMRLDFSCESSEDSLETSSLIFSEKQ